MYVHHDNTSLIQRPNTNVVSNKVGNMGYFINLNVMRVTNNRYSITDQP